VAVPTKGQRKRAFVPPKLVCYGKVEKITMSSQVGASFSGDWFGFGKAV